VSVCESVWAAIWPADDAAYGSTIGAAYIVTFCSAYSCSICATICKSIFSAIVPAIYEAIDTAQLVSGCESFSAAKYESDKPAK
jgi:hypothetical protein